MAPKDINTMAFFPKLKRDITRLLFSRENFLLDRSQLAHSEIYQDFLGQLPKETVTVNEKIDTNSQISDTFHIKIFHNFDKIFLQFQHSWCWSNSLGLTFVNSSFIYERTCLQFWKTIFKMTKMMVHSKRTPHFLKNSAILCSDEFTMCEIHSLGILCCMHCK